MNVDDSTYGYEPERDPALGLPPLNERGVDITRLHTQRLVPPDVARTIVLQRHELADLHRERALRLRQLASDVMQRFDTSSSAAMDRLNEWLFLQDLLVRTPAQERRFAALTAELLALEGTLERQWEAMSGMLREAVNHEVSAHMLTRTYQS